MPYIAGPFISPHLYLQWGGKLPGAEQWSCGLRLSPVATGPWPPEDAAGLIGAMATAVSTFHTSANTQIHSACKLSYVKLNMIDADGTYSLDTTNQVVLADVAGASNTSQPANQIALAITAETGFSRGPAHRGRFYLPMPGIGIAADGMVAAATITAIKGTATTFLTNLNAVSPKYKVAVHSRKAGSPAQRLVTSFSIGRVLDTQRRRRRSLVENYV